MSTRNVKFQSRIVANWDRIPKVEGRILGFGTMDVDGRESLYAMIDTTDGQVQVFQSEGLKDAFTAAIPGDFISIEFLGAVETKNKRRFKQFRSQVWTEPDAGPLPKVQAFKGGTSAKARR